VRPIALDEVNCSLFASEFGWSGSWAAKTYKD